MREALLWAALAVQLIGAGIALYGLASGWRDIRLSEKLIDPLVDRLKRIRHTLKQQISRLPWRRKRLQVHDARAGTGVAYVTLSTSHVGGKTANGPIARDLDLRDALDLLNDRINEALRNVVTVERRFDKEATDIRGRLSEVDSSLTTAIRDGAETQRRRAVRGLRIELVGFLILTLGSVAGALVPLLFD